MISRAIVAAAALACCWATPSLAKGYPSEPIKMYVGFSAGSATDIVARVVADHLGKRLGQPIVVENKVGAGGSIAAQDTARAKPNGYTLLTVSSAIAVNPAVYKSAAEVAGQLQPIALVGYLPTVLMVSNKAGIGSMGDLIKFAHQHPGKVNFGSSGIGGSTHMAMEAFSVTTGSKMTHVPYKGNGQASTAVMAGEIDVLMDTLLLAAPVIGSKRAVGLAVTGEQRSDLIPDVPTFAEAGVPGYNRSLFFGVMGPAGMPADVVEKLNHEINETLKNPEVKTKLARSGGLTLANLSVKEFEKIFKEEVETWKKVGASANIKPQ
ncbi:tripartite tricarboxylate transporter substrate binding protein [Pusillimonas sp. TS35]|uniref:Bug family tripartite tricarboxylate transporter substrate binding protein n=1 Tax=Paracandidimonas lactea TaxID=2895524 RepID=UPI00136DD87A|nr:tripartite tricarboxylate transporter substrate binding protein [Paracandidimonas lactea]MYN14126.1 tripartite tricarboxylate transporter substrate binding protein [Pusillimonas sp. TS35]